MDMLLELVIMAGYNTAASLPVTFIITDEHRIMLRLSIRKTLYCMCLSCSKTVQCLG